MSSGNRQSAIKPHDLYIYLANDRQLPRPSNVQLARSVHNRGGYARTGRGALVYVQAGYLTRPGLIVGGGAGAMQDGDDDDDDG